jgi:hypothetical protein
MVSENQQSMRTTLVLRRYDCSGARTVPSPAYSIVEVLVRHSYVAAIATPLLGEQDPGVSRWTARLARDTKFW